jgi:hypothetical protein
VNECIKSARLLALTIFGIGVVAIQIGWGEMARRERQDLFGYLEKILVANQIAPEATQSRGDPSRLDLGDLSDVPDLKGVLEAKAQEVNVKAGGFRTHADPYELCRPRLFRLSYGPEHPPLRLLWFEAQCARVQSFNEPVILLEGQQSEVAEVMVPPEIEQIMSAQSGPTISSTDHAQIADAHYLKDIVVGLLKDPRGFTASYAEQGEIPPGVKTVDSVERFVLATATRITGTLFLSGNGDAKDTAEAFGALVSADTAKRSILGFAVEPHLAVMVLPVILVGLSFSFWYRVRRIVAPLDDVREPWLPLAPRGRMERIGAELFALAIILVPAAAYWAVIAYDPDSLRDLKAAWSLSVNGPSLVQRTKDLTRLAGARQVLTNKAVWLTVPGIVAEAFILVGIAHLRVLSGRRPTTKVREWFASGVRRPRHSAKTRRHA